MRVVLLATLAGLATSCTLNRLADSAPEPQAILDAYLIAHGMAASTVQNPVVDPAVKAQLVRLDQRAHEAVRALTGPESGFADEAATARAVAALTAYAAQQNQAAP